MCSRFSTSVAKKRHLNQEQRQVPRSEKGKEGILQCCHSSAEGMNVHLGEWVKHSLAIANKCNVATDSARCNICIIHVYICMYM